MDKQLRRGEHQVRVPCRIDRNLDFDGCFNTRDLGGFRTASGRMTRFGAIVRSDALDHLSPSGWDALLAHGIRTVIDLRNDHELTRDASPRPSLLTTRQIALDGEDPEFWAYWGGGPRFCTPIYYRPHLERFPHLSAAVVAAIAHAPPGGVLFHCVIGRDRTGLIAMLLLALVGVSPDEIAADYAWSEERLTPLLARRGELGHRPLIEKFLAREGTTARELITSTLATLDVAAQLHRGGLSLEDLRVAQNRLLD